MELELRQAGGRVAMVQLLSILRQYSSSSATGRNLASRSRPSNCSIICVRPAGLEEESSSPSASTTTTTTTRSATICLRRGSFEVQQGCNCIPAGGDVELLVPPQSEYYKPSPTQLASYTAFSSRFREDRVPSFYSFRLGNSLSWILHFDSRMKLRDSTGI